MNIDDPFSLFDCATDALFRFGEPFKVVNAVPVAVRVGQVDTTIRKNSGGRRCSRNCKRRVVYVAQYDTTRLDVVANSTNPPHALNKRIIPQIPCEGPLFRSGQE